MQAYTFYMPVRVECGLGAAEKTGERVRELGGVKALIVSDSGVRKAGLLDRIERSVAAAGLSWRVFDEVEPNPGSDTVVAGTRLLEREQCDIVLAVGGGSSIDVAKGIAAMATNPGHILDYEGVGKLKRPALPLVAVPTTAGTGSEATAAAIITNRATKFKTAIISPHLFPRLAILDASLTFGLPRDITAATGMDALTHAIESYVSKQSNPASEALALQAMKLIREHIETAYRAGTDPHSREQMLIASMMAGAAFAQSRLGNVHAISHTLGGWFDIPHGVANAALLPYVMRFNLPACPAGMARIAEALGKETAGLPEERAAEAAVEAVVELNETLHIPRDIRSLGVTLDRLENLVEDAMRSGNVLVNPRLTAADDIRAIIESAYYGRLQEATANGGSDDVRDMGSDDKRAGE